MKHKIIPLLRDIMTLALLASAAFAMRLLPHPPNITPMGGLFLVAGSGGIGLGGSVLPFGALLLSDVILGFHATMPYVYGSYLAVFILGMFLQRSSRLLSVGILSLISSVLFFAVTNFGSWMTSGMYPHTLDGLKTAYVLGLPFFRNSLIGDLIYSLLFFRSYRFVAPFAKNLILYIRDRLSHYHLSR